MTSSRAEMQARSAVEKYSTISLFSGAGGLDVGLESTGKFDLLAAVEFEPDFCETLRINRDAGIFGNSKTKIIEADLAAFNPDQLMAELGIKPGEIDVVVGGPPCQSWSTAGRRGTVSDPRGMLLWDYLRFVKALEPKVFLMENVRGLLSAALRHRPLAERPAAGGSPLQEDEKPGSAIKTWIQDVLDIPGSNYRLDSFEVNSANYGAPQIRERVLFIGNRIGRVANFPKPTHGGEKREGLLLFNTLASALDGVNDEDPVLMDFSPRKKRFLDYVPEGGNWRAMPTEVAKESMGRAFTAKGGRSGWWRRLSWDLPSPTITTMPNHSSTSLCHPEETRVLSVRECAAIQEFPPEWSFFGSPSSQMKQVGNAVPARLGRVAGLVLDDLLSSNDSKQEGGIPRYTNTYLNSHIRTRSWWKDGKAVVRNIKDVGEESQAPAV